MCRVSLDIVALALFTSYGGVVYEPRGIRISRCVFKYCCGVEFPSILRKFDPLYLLSPRWGVRDDQDNCIQTIAIVSVVRIAPLRMP